MLCLEFFGLQHRNEPRPFELRSFCGRSFESHRPGPPPWVPPTALRPPNCLGPAVPPSPAAAARSRPPPPEASRSGRFPVLLLPQALLGPPLWGWPCMRLLSRLVLAVNTCPTLSPQPRFALGSRPPRPVPPGHRHSPCVAHSAQSELGTWRWRSRPRPPPVTSRLVTAPCARAPGESPGATLGRGSSPRPARVLPSAARFSLPSVPGTCLPLTAPPARRRLGARSWFLTSATELGLSPGLVPSGRPPRGSLVVHPRDADPVPRFPD